MPKTKLNIIKPFLAVNGMPDGDLIVRLYAAHDGLLNNLAYKPPVDLGVYKAAIDRFTAAAAAVLHNGGKSDIEERNKSRADAIVLYRQLAHYVEVACNNDMNTFVSSGFLAAASTARTSPQPVSVPSIFSLDQGSSGQFLVTINPVAKALHYELRCAGGCYTGSRSQLDHDTGQRHETPGLYQ